MSLEQAHKIALTLCAGLSAAVLLVATGGQGANFWLAPLLPLAAWLGKRPVRGPARAVPLLRQAPLWALGLLLLTLLSHRGGAWGLLDGAALATALLVARLLTAQLPSHDGQALLLSATLVCAATVLTPSAWLAPLLLAYVSLLTVALVTRQLLFDAYMLSFRSGDSRLAVAALARTDIVTPRLLWALLPLVAILLGTGVLVFVAFPRGGPPSGLWSGGESSSVPDDVSLTAAPRALGGGRPLARVVGLSEAAFQRGLYLRVSLYDRWQAGTFHVSLAPLPWQTEVGAARAARLWPYQLRFNSDLFGQVASLGPVASARWYSRGDSGQRLEPGDQRRGQAWTQGEPRPIRLDLVGPLWPSYLDASATHRCAQPQAGPPGELALPAGLDGRIAPLAARLTANADSAAAKARLLRTFLQGNATYSLTPSGAAGPDPLADFLFGGRSGHCEYFATAFALMLRAAGVPSRVVGGFAFGAWEPAGQVVVFGGRHAHAWVEWWDPCQGWLLDDATPPQEGEVLGPVAAMGERWRRLWDEQVIAYGASEQLTLWRSLVEGTAPLVRPVLALVRQWTWPAANMVAGAAAALCALLAGLWLRAPRWLAWEQQMAGVLHALLRARLGRPLRASETFSQAARAGGAAQAAEFDQRLAELIASYERQRFGARHLLPAPEARRLLRAARELARQLQASHSRRAA